MNSEADLMVEAAVKVYGGGKRELSKDQFATLLVDILTDISDRLASNPVVLTSSATVCNGSKLRKVRGTFVSNGPAWNPCGSILLSEYRTVKRRG